MKVGNRVKLIRKNNNLILGSVGTIVEIGSALSVDWDDFIQGHDCNGLARMGHGWNVNFSAVELIEEYINPKKQNVINRLKTINLRR